MREVHTSYSLRRVTFLACSCSQAHISQLYVVPAYLVPGTAAGGYEYTVPSLKKMVSDENTLLNLQL